MTTIQCIEHVAAAGERWDLLAWKYYGDPTYYGPIIMANPTVPIAPVFDSGTTVLVPILPASNVVTVNLPPWKAAGTGAS